MKEIAKYDNWFKILSISVIVIVVCVFTLTVSNTHLAKGTYATQTGEAGTNSCNDRNSCQQVAAGLSSNECPYGAECYESPAGSNCYLVKCKSQSASECANKTIFFSYSQGGEGIPCTADENGDFSESCIARAEALCSRYSTEPGQSCYRGGDGSSARSYTNSCANETVYCVEGYSHGCECGTNCGGETPTNPPSKSSEPSKSSSPSKDNTSCFECNGEYVWTNNPGSNCEKITSITSEDKCVKTSCYKCVKTNATEYLYATSESNAKSITDANSCSKTDDKYCKENIIVNPPTGTAGIIVAWLVGLSAIVYSFWYFKKNSAMK